ALLARGGGDAYDHMIVALGRAAQGDIAGAEALFARALTLDPADVSVLTGQAAFLREQGRLREAVLACDKAIGIAPGYADAWLERGAILAAGGAIAPSRESFATAAKLAPRNSSAHAGLASLGAREGDHAAARLHAERALSLDPGNAIAICALASAEMASGDPAAARARLEALTGGLATPSQNRSLAAGLAGDACDRLGDHHAAYRHYAQCKADFAAIHARAAEGRLTHRQFIEAIDAGLRALTSADWSAPAPAISRRAHPRHVFLLGYPRSGTTLLENVLASLPGVAALEERPTLVEADQAYLMGNHADIVAGLARFAQLDADGLEALRDAYWSKVVAAGVPADTPCFVDMDPLKGTRLPLIARLFPDARILLMRRDPRDVVWSCFRTNFAMTSGTLDYTSLDRAARHYDALMRLTKRALDLLPIKVHVVQYHRLVQDFDATTQAICAFLGLEWRETMRQFDRTAARRGVSTASAPQIRRGLYDGTGQWQPYADYLAPVMPILQPWIERFGYGNSG
ncbi:MAG: sulfotransferase, partial [Novosphingobium sp.]